MPLRSSAWRVVLALLVAGPALADEVVFRLVAEEGGRLSPATLRIRDLPDGAVGLVREAARTAGPPVLMGVGRRTRDGFEAELQAPASPGLAGVLGGAGALPPAPPVRAVYALAGGRLSGVLARPGWSARDVGAVEPLSPTAYAPGWAAPAWAPGAGQPAQPWPGAPTDRGAPIDLARENAGASRLLRARSERERARRWPVVVCPGFAADDQTTPLHPTARARAALAARALRETGALVVLVSGGNVHPPGTPYNEAMELKRALVELGVSPERIAVDPYARHSTTNLRNAGRFLLAHGVDRALVVSSPLQSFYFGHPWLSTFHIRCLLSLGHRVGTLRAVGRRETAFWPSPRCARRGDDPRDP